MRLYPSKILLTLLLVTGLGSVVLSQEPVEVNRSRNKVILEGKVYYIHVVEPGQTLFAISRAYNVSQKEIAVENPGVMSGIQIGQALKIPVNPIMREDVDTSRTPPALPQGRMHRVQAGETVYRISRMYGLTEEELLRANPEIQNNDLPLGFALRIPDAGTGNAEPGTTRIQQPQEDLPAAGQAFNEEGFLYHKVKRKETLYSIGRFYQVTVEDIRSANPELGWGGPKTGQTIRIPRPQAPEHPESILDPFGGGLAQDTATVAETDTLVPYVYEELVDLPYDAGRVYRVAYLIPFDYKAATPLDSLLKDAKSDVRRQRITERFRLEQAEPQSVAFLEFFQGSLLALDSLSRAGMKVEVRFYDTRKSMARTRDILNKPGMERMDLIIGPFYPFNLELVSQFAREHRIPVVTPFYGETDLIRENPYLFQPTPGIETEYRALARLVASHYEDNIVFVQDGDSLIRTQQDLLKELIFEGFERFRPSEPVTFKEIELDVINTDEIIHSLRPGKKNLVVVPTRNPSLASSLVQSLYYQRRNFDIEVVGNSNWTEFSSIDYRRYHELKLIFYSGFWKDYKDPDVTAFLRKYRKEFHSEPQFTTSTGINYGIAGYDLSFYFLSALRSKGPRFLLDLDRISPHQVLSPYHFVQVSTRGGFENTALHFYQFKPDMTIRELHVPEYPANHFYFRPLEDRRQDHYLNFDGGRTDE